MQPAERIQPGLTPERVAFFTDAIFAIAMTLLVIDIPKPEEGEQFDPDHVGKAQAARNMLDFLGGHAGAFISYLLAFVILWTVWRHHHGLFDRLERLSPAFVAWHLPLLLLIAFLPYPTVVFDQHTGNPVGAAFFALAIAALLACKSAAQGVALREGLLRPDVDAQRYGTDVRIGRIVAGFYAASVLLCWWTPWVLIAWNFGPFLGLILNRRRDRQFEMAGAA